MIGVLLVLLEVTGRVAAGHALGPNPGGQQDVPSLRPERPAPDLRLTTGTLLTERVAPGQHLLLCQDGFSMTVAGRQYTSRRGLVWIAPRAGEAPGGPSRGYHLQVYLDGRVSSRGIGAARADGLEEVTLKRDRVLAVRMSIDGEVFVTADNHETGDPWTRPLYQEAIAGFKGAGWRLPPRPSSAGGPAGPPTRLVTLGKPSAPAGAAEPNRPGSGYTINLAPLTDVAPKLERQVTENGDEITTLIGRTYLWWEQPRDGEGRAPELLEVEADSFVMWRRAAGAGAKGADLLAARMENVSEIYVGGDVVFRQGPRTISADELYYDLRQKRAVATNVVMRSFDPVRNIPIYLRAEQLRQVDENRYEADTVVVTTSEFWTPQLSLRAAHVRINDETAETELDETPPAPEAVDAADSASDFEMRKVRLKYGNLTVFAWPVLRANRQRPDVPIRSVRVGYDSTYGSTVETRWYLNRLLGLREPPGTESTLALDYYGKRGPAGGVEITYERENYFGSLLGYVIDDHGLDRLSRTRRDIEVPENLRGRLRLQHRHYLPYGWQLTAEASYLSDENFLEQFYPTEYNVGKEQETLLYLKRIQDNWGLAFLGKVRTIDFFDQVEELPSAEYHLTGQSLFDDRFTFFSDNQVSQYRYRVRRENPARGPEDLFLFTGTRNELDLPLAVGTTKVVPFVAGTFGYDDGAGFRAALDEERVTPENAVGIGEAGLRMSLQPYWAVYPEVRSRLWDLNQFRHVLAPSLTAVGYAASDVVADQRHTLDLQLAQRWQTKRGPADDPRTVDWLQWNTDFVWVDADEPESARADRLLWNWPFVPLANRAGRMVPPLDRRATDLFGPRQDYVSTDASLQVSDTTMLMGGVYFGMQTSALEQADVGFSRTVWPDLSYYLGTRYLRTYDIGQGPRSARILTFSATYVLDARYSLVLSEQYDFVYQANITTDVTLVRKYHRLNLGLTFNISDALDDRRIFLSLWPEGLPEASFGQRRYLGLGASDVYY
ncbi:MAG: hypothetical protein MUC88_17915 [Planctomycetes bacterium]|jgi:hypothetical protein|nr:hypothetical protein [Planctomycetota bacterium]